MCVHYVFQVEYKEMRGSSKYWGENVSADDSATTELVFNSSAHLIVFVCLFVFVVRIWMLESNKKHQKKEKVSDFILTKEGRLSGRSAQWIHFRTKGMLIIWTPADQTDRKASPNHKHETPISRSPVRGSLSGLRRRGAPLRHVAIPSEGQKSETNPGWRSVTATKRLHCFLLLFPSEFLPLCFLLCPTKCAFCVKPHSVNIKPLIITHATEWLIMVFNIYVSPWQRPREHAVISASADLTLL